MFSVDYWMPHSPQFQHSIYDLTGYCMWGEGHGCGSVGNLNGDGYGKGTDNGYNGDGSGSGLIGIGRSLGYGEGVGV